MYNTIAEIEPVGTDNPTTHNREESSMDMKNVDLKTLNGRGLLRLYDSLKMKAVRLTNTIGNVQQLDQVNSDLCCVRIRIEALVAKGHEAEQAVKKGAALAARADAALAVIADDYEPDDYEPDGWADNIDGRR